MVALESLVPEQRACVVRLAIERPSVNDHVKVGFSSGEIPDHALRHRQVPPGLPLPARMLVSTSTTLIASATHRGLDVSNIEAGTTLQAHRWAPAAGRPQATAMPSSNGCAMTSFSF